MLEQNYPNPFNPSTKIRFNIPAHEGNSRDRSVRIIVYDILGREIAELVNGNFKPGSYEVNWDASQFASGIYYYSLITDSYKETKKLTLAK